MSKIIFNLSTEFMDIKTCKSNQQKGRGEILLALNCVVGNVIFTTFNFNFKFKLN